MSSASISRSFLLRKHTLSLSRPSLRLLTSRAATPPDNNTTKNRRSTLTNFSLSDSDTEDNNTTTPTTKTIETPKKLPPPYNPFEKSKPEISEDPKNIQEIFHKMRSEDGLMQHAVKMFDALSKDGLTHEALALFGEIKDKGNMPDVIAHTAVIETYANGGRLKDALTTYLRMLASGVLPNAYTYAVLIKGLVKDGKFSGDAKKYLVEMIGKGMWPNAETYVAVFEAFVREEKEDEARELMEMMKGKGFVAKEKDVREAMKDQTGHVFRTVMDILFG